VTKLAIEIPEVVARRLEALSGVLGKSVDELARKASIRLWDRGRREEPFSKHGALRREPPVRAIPLQISGGWMGMPVRRSTSCCCSKEPMGSILYCLRSSRQSRRKIETAGPAKITGVELMVLSVLALEREVSNGGYDQFFRNSSRRFAPMIVNHLVTIGCPAIADITQEALDSLDLPETERAGD